VLDAGTSNVDGFLSRGNCGSSTQLKRPTWNKMCISPHLEP
jgi:hypothetical protein